jgi:hypothetical protein
MRRGDGTRWLNTRPPRAGRLLYGHPEEKTMFIHPQKLQDPPKPEKPHAAFTRKLQEVIGGQYGEITVAMRYSFQAWNVHIPGKYRDLLFSTATEVPQPAPSTAWATRGPAPTSRPAVTCSPT